VRHGATTRFLTEPDVADAYRRRFSAAAYRDEQWARAISEAVGRAPGDRKARFVMVLVPDRAGSMHIDEPTFKRFKQFANDAPVIAPWHSGGFPEAAVGPGSLHAGAGRPNWAEWGERSAGTRGSCVAGGPRFLR